MLKKSLALYTIGNGTLAPGTINQPKVCCVQQRSKPKNRPKNTPRKTKSWPSKKNTKNLDAAPMPIAFKISRLPCFSWISMVSAAIKLKAARTKTNSKMMKTTKRSD